MISRQVKQSSTLISINHLLSFIMDILWYFWNCFCKYVVSNKNEQCRFKIFIFISNIRQIREVIALSIFVYLIIHNHIFIEILNINVRFESGNTKLSLIHICNQNAPVSSFEIEISL